MDSTKNHTSGNPETVSSGTLSLRVPETASPKASETSQLRDSETASAETAFITVVMPVRNEERFIAETLGQLLRQDYPADRYEIIVADGLSDDRTREIVRDIREQHFQIKLLDNPKYLSSAGRNVGFKNGKGDYFLVVDGHCFIPDNQLFKNVAECFEKSASDCLGRPQPLDPPGLTRFQNVVAMARGSKLGHGGDSLIYGEFEGYASPVSNGAAYRRDVFEKIGYVDENFDACEDLEFNYRVEKAGLKAYTSPKLTVRYYPREDLKGLFRQMVRYGRGRFRFIRKHPEAVTLNQLVPAAFVAGLMLLAVFGLVSLVAMGGAVTESRSFDVTKLMSVPHLFYAVLVLAESVRLAKNNKWTGLSALPMVFFTIHFGLGYGFVVEALKSVLSSEGKAVTESRSLGVTE